MNALHDILLDKPLEGPWMTFLLVFTFALHLLFVLFTMGTAMIGGGLIVAGRYGGRPSLNRWGKSMFHAFFVHKSMAIVLAIAPILLLQVGHTVPVLVSVNLFATPWLYIVVLLVLSLLLIESVNEGWARRRLPVCLAITGGIAVLFIVPGIFAAIVVATENPAQWNEMLALGGRFPPALAAHWGLRLLHVVVAAFIFTSALHYVLTPNALKRKILVGWMVSGLMVQFVVGTALYASVPRQPQLMIALIILVGVSVAGVWTWKLYRSRNEESELSVLQMTTLAGALFMAMILGRQLLQDQVLIPVEEQLVENREQYKKELFAAAGGAPMARNTENQPVPQSNAATVYLRSCGFCHGAVGDGQGDSAHRLFVPPEDLTGLRIGDAALQKILLEGVDGTGMPRFGYYTRGELQDLTLFLREQMNMAAVPEPVTHATSPEAVAQADKVFAETCITCHDKNGQPTETSARFDPAPPNLATLTLSPDYGFKILSNGYPGTMMPAFDHLPEETRWALVTLVHKMYVRPKVESPPKPPAK